PAGERAHLLADVTAEDPVADQGPQLTGDGASLLDGQVRDAAACIHDRCTGNVASEQRARGTCVYTGAACTAMVAGERLVVVELELDEQCAEEHVRPVPGLQQHRVAPLPAETRALFELALHHGPRAHVRACSLEAASGLRLDPVQERELPLLHDFVVITPARVPCNDSAVPGRALITARRV